MKTKKVLKLSGLLLALGFFVALIFGSSMVSKVANAETEFNPVSYRYTEGDGKIVMVDLLDEENARLRLIETFGDGSTEHARVNAVYKINGDILYIEAMNGDLQYNFVINDGYNLTSVEQEEEFEDEYPPAVEYHTIWTRLEEWLSVNFLEFISSIDLAALIGAIVVIIIEGKINRKSNDEAKASLTDNTDEIKRNTESNDKVLDVANQLIDTTNALAESEEKLDLNVEKLLSLNKAVLEILVTVYVNNKNIPQATKDLVNMKYVSAIKEEADRFTNDTREELEG